jgi:hypothetical protein
MKRQHQFVLIAATLGCSWLAMQAVHELGHVVGAAVSGGRVAAVVLHPATISQTRLAANPHPLFVVWMGPVVGSVLPVATWLLARRFFRRGAHLLRFFAGFCLIANGAYLAFGSIDSIGDAGDLLHHGAPSWLLWMFGVITIPLGLWLWNGLGPQFGLGSRGGEVDRAAAYVMLGLLVMIVVIELALSALPINS